MHGDNGREKQKESYAFLEKMKEKCDKISWILGSKFIHKYYKLCKKSSFDLELKKKIKFLNGSFLRNPQKVEIITLDELNIEVQEYSHILKEIILMIIILSKPIFI